MKTIDELIGEINLRYSKGPIWEHSMRYDTNVGMLEPIYYWIIDFLSSVGFKQEKLIDNFTAAPGSSYFAELGQRATRMQEEGMKILGMVNTVIKSIINLVYDLKDFDLRLEKYKEFHSSDPETREMGMLGLKEIWMNKVDAQRGMGSINNMAHQYGFTLLRPAFMAAKSPEQVKEIDINKIVMKVLIPRVSEFFTWIKLSEEELNKRYNVQKAYLKNQVDTLKLYSRWVTPYLKAAEQLRMKENTEPSLVSVFGAMILELSIMSKKQEDIVGAAKAKNLPQYFAKIPKKIRGLNEIVLVDFKFRTYPTQAAPHTGRVDIKFRAYALNDDELKLLDKERSNESLTGLLGMSESVASESIKQLVADIEKYTQNVPEDKTEKEGLFEGLFNEITKKFTNQTRSESIKEKREKEKEKKKKEEEHIKKLVEEGIQEDNYEETVAREFTEIQAAEWAFRVYDIFKKSQGMASFPSPFEEPEVYKRFREKRAEIKALMAESVRKEAQKQ